MAKVSIQYLAGLFDGEGCIQIAQRSHGTPPFRLHVEMSNTNKKLPILFKREFGGCLCILKHRANGWADVYQWATVNRDAGLALLKMRPYIIGKAKELEIGLAFQSRMKYTGKSLSIREWNIRHRLMLKLRAVRESIKEHR